MYKQETAYEVEYGLVGSEMCRRVRDEEGGAFPFFFEDAAAVAAVDADV